MGENKNCKQQGHASVIILYATKKPKGYPRARKIIRDCPVINWEHLTVKSGSEKEVQQQLIETTTSASLTQIHDQPTRADNMLDLVFTSNPSLIKTSVSVPGISDHDIVITDMEIKPHYQKILLGKAIYTPKQTGTN